MIAIIPCFPMFNFRSITASGYASTRQMAVQSSASQSASNKDFKCTGWKIARMFANVNPPFPSPSA